MAPSHKNQPIKFDLPNNISDGTEIICKTIFANIDCSIYGKLIDFEANIPLFLLKGEYKKSNFFDMTFEEQNKIYEEIVDELRHVHTTLDEEELKQKSMGFVNMSATLWPGVDAHSKLFLNYGILLFLAFSLDDIVDSETTETNILTTKIIFKTFKSFKQKFTTGKLDAIEKMVPTLIPYLKLVQKAFQEIENETLAKEYNKFIKKHLILIAQTFPLRYDARRAENITEQGHKLIRGIDSGMDGLLQLGLTHNRTVIPSKIEKSLLYKLFLDNQRIRCGLVNDIMGLPKDARLKETHANTILRQVVFGGIPLETALKMEVQYLQNLTKDAHLLSSQLIEAFSEYPEVAEFVRLSKTLQDGQIFGYITDDQCEKRYAGIKLEIVPS